MHWTTHILVGSSLGYLLENPAAATLAGIASHLVLDVFPHHDPESDVGYLVDAAVGTGLLAFLVESRAIREIDARHSMLWGGIGGALPDAELLLKLFIDMEDEDYLFPAHNGLLPHLQAGPVVSTSTQALLVSLCALVVALKVRHVGYQGSPSA